MIENPENITIELTDYEKNTLVPVIVKGLSQMVGKEHCFNSKQCIDKLRRLEYDINEASFRGCIRYIRIHNLVPGLIGTPKGYYKAANRKEVEAYLASLKERKKSIEEIIKSIECDLLTF